MATSRPTPSQSSTEVDQLVRASIRGLRPISALYEGRWRLLCPPILGRNKHGQVRILCYQFGGDSASGLQLQEGSGEWRCLALDKVSHVSLLDSAWRTSADSVRRPKCMDCIELAVGQPDRDPQ